MAALNRCQRMKLISKEEKYYVSQPIISRAKEIPTGYDLCNLVLLTASSSLLNFSRLFPFTPVGFAVTVEYLVSAMNCSPCNEYWALQHSVQKYNL